MPIPDDKKIEKMKFLSVGPTFAEALTRIHSNESISKIFEGNRF